MAIELIEGFPTIWNLSPGGSNTIWTPESGITVFGYHSIEYSDGRKELSPGSDFFSVPERAFLLVVSSFEHASADGHFPTLLVNERNDVVIPLRHYACNREWGYPGPNGTGVTYGVAGSDDSYRVEYIFPPAGTWRVASRFSAWGTGASQSNFVPEPYDPVHAWSDGGGSILMLFEDVQAVADIQRTGTPANATNVDGLPSLTVSTPNTQDQVIEVLIAESQASDYLVPDSAQTILLEHRPGALQTGWPFFEQPQIYIAQKARTGATTNVSWDYSDSPYTAKYNHLAMVLR